MKERKPHIPDIIKDKNTGVSYRKGQFYGKGGFGICYEIIDLRTGNIFAAKIISKVTCDNKREKILREIQFHLCLDYKHIVHFYGSFEDSYNIYIVLELCRNRSMWELLTRRRVLTEPEVRYFMRQIVLGVNYLHQRGIIHRDLTLGNLLLDDNLNVKIADFGMAEKIKYGETMEYRLLVGELPVWTDSRKKQLDCNVLDQFDISKSAVSLIKHMFQHDSKCRPNVSEFLKFEFFTDGYFPKQLPASCLTTAPKFDGNSISIKAPIEVNAADKFLCPQ